jgi:PIN domain nuclease of toxin-antitoxin system
LIQNEPDADRVAGRLATAAISAVNLAEVITILLRRSGGPDAAYSSRLFAYLADAGLSLDDRACITEGIRFAKTRIAKTDRAWKKVRSVESRVIRIR